MSHIFRSSTKHKVIVPLTVTKAGDVIAAICNRDDTHNVIGDRTPGPNRKGYHIPVSIVAMSHILGPELGQNFYETIGNPAFREYYIRVTRRLKMVSIELAFSGDFWYIIKTPNLESGITLVNYPYHLLDLERQGPAGYTGADDVAVM